MKYRVDGREKPRQDVADLLPPAAGQERHGRALGIEAVPLQALFAIAGDAHANAAAIDLAFSLEQDTWNGERYLQLSVADFKAPEN